MILPFIFLVLICFTHSIPCYLSYEKWAQDKWWYLPVALFFGGMNMMLWFIATRIISNLKTIYIYSLIWDLIVVSVYFLLPIIAFQIKLNKFGIIGLMLMVIGFLLVKFEFK